MTLVLFADSNINALVASPVTGENDSSTSMGESTVYITRNNAVLFEPCHYNTTGHYASTSGHDTTLKCMIYILHHYILIHTPFTHPFNGPFPGLPG